jgi:hypothetical protein
MIRMLGDKREQGWGAPRRSASSLFHNPLLPLRDAAGQLGVAFGGVVGPLLARSRPPPQGAAIPIPSPLP